MDGYRFLTFEVRHSANGFEEGWYFRMTTSLYDEPVGPFPTKEAAEEDARKAQEEARA